MTKPKDERTIIIKRSALDDAFDAHTIVKEPVPDEPSFRSSTLSVGSKPPPEPGGTQTGFEINAREDDQSSKQSSVPTSMEMTHSQISVPIKRSYFKNPVVLVAFGMLAVLFVAKIIPSANEESIHQPVVTSTKSTVESATSKREAASVQSAKPEAAATKTPRADAILGQFDQAFFKTQGQVSR